MIKMYGTSSCPDCAGVAEKIKAGGRESEFEITNIGEHMAYLRAFLQPRDREEAFRPVKEGGYVDTPYFVRGGGTMSPDPAELGFREGLTSVTNSGKIGIVTDFMREIGP